MTVPVCKQLGAARVILVGTRPNRLEVGHRLGADHIINAREQDPVTAIQELTGGAGVDLAVENIAPGQLAWRPRTAGTHAGRTGHACGKGTMRDCVEATVPWRTKAGDFRHRLMLYAPRQACTAHH